MSLIGSIFGGAAPFTQVTDNTSQGAYAVPIQRHPGSIQSMPLPADAAYTPSPLQETDMTVRVTRAKNGRILSVYPSDGTKGRLWVVPDGEDLAKYIAAAIAEQAMAE